MADKFDKPTFEQSRAAEAARAKKAAEDAQAATAATAELVPPREKTREELLEEVKRLTEQLEVAQQDQGAAIAFTSSRARLIGKTTEHDIVQGEERDRETELWEYTIDLPPSGGMDVRINGMPFFHGQTYRVTTGTLRVLMDQVNRSWTHESNIKGSNENAYRRMREVTLRGDRRAA